MNTLLNKRDFLISGLPRIDRKNSKINFVSFLLNWKDNFINAAESRKKDRDKDK